MYIRFDEHRVTVHNTDKAFRRRSALENVDHIEWLRILRETASVERQMRQLQQVERTVYTG